MLNSTLKAMLCGVILLLIQSGIFAATVTIDTSSQKITSGGTIYGLVTNRNGNSGSITYTATTHNEPLPTMEYGIVCEYEWALDGVVIQTSESKDCTFQLSTADDWGKTYNITCTAVWYQVKTINITQKTECDRDSDSASFIAPDLKKLSGRWVTSDKKYSLLLTDDETIFLSAGYSAFTITADVSPNYDYPSNFVTWSGLSSNNIEIGTTSKTVEIKNNLTVGTYVLSATCAGAVKCIRIVVSDVAVIINATDLDGNVTAVNNIKTAYVHWNIDNDNNSATVAAENVKHPGGDYREIGTVNNENDLKSFTLVVDPVTLTSGSIELTTGSGCKIWKNATKGAANLLVDANVTKTWDLSNTAERNEFFGLGTLYMEGVEEGPSNLRLKYIGTNEKTLSADNVKYIFIAANCGEQPSVTLRSSTNIGYPNVINCEWSVTGEADVSYNCIAWSIGETNVWYNDVGGNYTQGGVTYISIDNRFGDNNNILSDDDIDKFYDAKGYKPILAGTHEERAANADIIYYSGFHAAKKSGCNCGNEKWIIFDSKRGNNVRMEHIWNALSGSNYGDAKRFYIKK